MTCQFAVIGRGIAGLTAAYHLRNAGKSVSIFGPVSKAGSASRAALGMVVMRGVRGARDPVHIVKELAYHQIRQWISRLEMESGKSIPNIFESVYEPIFSKEELIRYQLRDEDLRRTEIRACKIHTDLDLGTIPPVLSKNLQKKPVAFIEYPGDGWFSSVALLNSLEESLRYKNVQFYPRSIVKIAPHPESGWYLYSESGERYFAANVVVACGVFAEAILVDLGVLLPFRRVGGMLLEFTTPNFLDGVIFSRRKNLVSYRQTSWIGAVDFKRKESVGFSAGEIQSGISQLLDIANLNFGGLEPKGAFENSNHKYLSGVRSYVKDRMPVVGALDVAGINRRIFLSLGYHKNGMQVADICGENLTKVINNQSIPQVFHHFSPKRLLDN